MKMKFLFFFALFLWASDTSCLMIPEEKIHRLRKAGIEVIKNRDYEKALNCYSALIQLYEGLPGQEMAMYRMQCGVTLAECHMHLGNTEEAIARFSDVIDELPVIDTVVNHNEDGDECEQRESSFVGETITDFLYRSGDETKRKDYQGGHAHKKVDENEGNEMLCHLIGEFLSPSFL